MSSGGVKRHASRSPTSDRDLKRVAASSPEEGEVDDATPVGKTPLPAPPSSLPPKPITSKTKVPFPFKPKSEMPRNGLDATNSPAPYLRCDSDDARRRPLEFRRRNARPFDHWEPEYRRRVDDSDRFYPPREHDGDSGRYYGSFRTKDREHSRRVDRDRGLRRDDRSSDYYDGDRLRRAGKIDSYRPLSPHPAPTPPLGLLPERPTPHENPPYPQLPHAQRSPGPSSEPKPCGSPPPPPPSSSPPPVPPPDIPKTECVNLPPDHAPVHISLKRPAAPKGGRSPASFPLPSAPPKADTAQPEVDNKESQPRPVRKRDPIRRTSEEEEKAYGRAFAGCGNQNDYSVLTKLGEGTFGEVHKAIHKGTGAAVALKRILMHNEKEGMPVTALREIKILKALKHPCIVQILDMFVVRSSANDPLSVYMVFPYMDHDLAGLLENDRVKLQPSQIKLYMKQLLEGTEYMHRNHILHRDMKAANLLISNSGSLQIADFGLARSFDGYGSSGNGDSRGRERKYTNCVVTRWYRPPELLLGARQYGGEVDIWGIGCVLGEMFWRRPILPGNSDLDQLDKIWQLCGTPNQHTWPNFDALPGCEGVKRFNSYSRKLKQTWESIGQETCDLMDKLLTCNPRERITAAQALDHDYFWTDPLPADPKSLPSYEASHEFDKRGHRNYPPQPNPPPLQLNLNRPVHETLNGSSRNIPRFPRSHPLNPHNGPPRAGGIPPPIGIPGQGPLHLPPPRGQRPPHQRIYHPNSHMGYGPDNRHPRPQHLPPRPQAPQGVISQPRGTTAPPRQDVEARSTELNYG